MPTRIFAFVCCALHTLIAASIAVQSLIRDDVPIVDSGLNATALALFEKSRLSYERQYDYYGRVPAEVDMPSNVLSLDFEIETSAAVKLSPEILLQRCSIDLSSQPGTQETYAPQQEGFYRRSEDDDVATWDPPRTTWPKVSEYFTMGIDGTGRITKIGENLDKKRYRQELTGQIEIETKLFRPQQVVSSSFTQELQAVLDKLWQVKLNRANHSRIFSSKWYSLPFPGSTGIKITGAVDPRKACTGCSVQWTVGIVLSEVPALLAMTHSRPLQKILKNVEGICDRREGGCAQEYRAFVSLAAWTLSALRRCEGCAHPKRCTAPWLVRTHFGDLAMHLKDKLGANVIAHLPVDVLEAAKVRRSDKVLPHGVVDYLRLPEMAEFGGFVFPRGNADSLKYLNKDEAVDMPTTPEGLLSLSRKMLQQRRLVNERLDKRACGIHGRNDVRVSDFTPEAWLRGLLRGKDLMSDHDSPLSESSFSHLVWKSMGSWRMKPGSNRVYLECRNTDACIGTGHLAGPVAVIDEVGRRMASMEHTIKQNKKLPQATAPAADTWTGKVDKRSHAPREAKMRSEVLPRGQIAVNSRSAPKEVSRIMRIHRR
jgi:hypothetical protein